MFSIANCLDLEKLVFDSTVGVEPLKGHLFKNVYISLF